MSRLERAALEFLLDAGAEAILDRMKGARSRLRQWLDGRRDVLRIAASASTCHYILPAALREFRNSFPGVTIHIEPASMLRL